MNSILMKQFKEASNQGCIKLLFDHQVEKA